MEARGDMKWVQKFQLCLTVRESLWRRILKCWHWVLSGRKRALHINVLFPVAFLKENKRWSPVWQRRIWVNQLLFSLHFRSAYTFNGMLHLLKKKCLASRFVQFGEWLSTWNELSFGFFSSSREFWKLSKTAIFWSLVSWIQPQPLLLSSALEKKKGLTSK